MCMISIRQQLYSLDSPRVMAIINITPDSFAFSCRSMTEEEVLTTASLALANGADILDIGGCSTRPNAEAVTEEEEWCRVDMGLRVIKRAFPQAILSLDTSRPVIAARALEQYGVDIINDVSGGTEAMYEVVAAHRVPYVLTHSKMIEGDPLCAIVDELVRRLDTAHRMGVRDVIIDPGFGFDKTKEQNYAILAGLEQLREMGTHLLVGLSRKSMIYNELNVDSRSEEALVGTAALQMIALEKGACILRAHDVCAAKNVIKLYQCLVEHQPKKHTMKYISHQ